MGVAVIRLDHPPVNAVNLELLDALDARLVAADRDDDIGAAVIVGAGRGFCAGGDTSGLTSLQDPVAKRRFLARANEVIERVTGLAIPVISAVHGYAIGAGVSLAAACDVVIAESDTLFRLAFRDLAITPDMGAHFFLAQAFGARRAKELIWAGGAFTAEEAATAGLVNRVVPVGTAFDVALDAAHELVRGPRDAIAYTKLVFAGADAEQLRQVLDAEAWASALLRTTADHEEGVAASREKRRPDFGELPPHRGGRTQSSGSARSEL